MDLTSPSNSSWMVNENIRTKLNTYIIVTIYMAIDIEGYAGIIILTRG